MDLRRRFKAVLDVLDGVTGSAVSLSRSIELTVHWRCILRIGPICTVAQCGFQPLVGRGLGEFLWAVERLDCRVSDFIYRVVVQRGDDAVRG